MGIVGDRPSNGVRITVERSRTALGSRARGEASPWQYDGVASTPDADYAITATIDAAGEVAVQVASSEQGPAPPDLAEKVRLILRTVYRQSKADGEAAPARKIVRWRGEK